jgi:hypothetical protein
MEIANGPRLRAPADGVYDGASGRRRCVPTVGRSPLSEHVYRIASSGPSSLLFQVRRRPTSAHSPGVGLPRQGCKIQLVRRRRASANSGVVAVERVE